MLVLKDVCIQFLEKNFNSAIKNNVQKLSQYARLSPNGVIEKYSRQL